MQGGTGRGSVGKRGPGALRGGKRRVDPGVERFTVRIQIYTTVWCGFCRAAKALFAARGISFEEIDVGVDPAFRQRLFELTGGRTVPQILIDGEPIGGYSELRALERAGRLDELVSGESHG